MLSAAALTSDGPPESLAAAERSSPPPAERDSAVLTSSIRMPFSRWMYLAVGKKGGKYSWGKNTVLAYNKTSDRKSHSGCQICQWGRRGGKTLMAAKSRVGPSKVQGAEKANA